MIGNGQGACPALVSGDGFVAQGWHPQVAEVRRSPELVSEDFQSGRLYGTVTIRNPFEALRPVT